MLLLLCDLNKLPQKLKQEEEAVSKTTFGNPSGGKGAEFKKMTYQELGKYETIDHVQNEELARPS